MSAAEIIDALRTRDVSLCFVGDRIRLDAPKGVVTPELRQRLSEHKAELLSHLSRGTPDWNRPFDPSGAKTPFNESAMDAIKGGKAVRVWSGVLGEWLWWVRDEEARRTLLAEGCKLPIYTLGELAVVARMKVGGLRDLHQMKKKFGGTIRSPTSRK